MRKKHACESATHAILVIGAIGISIVKIVRNSLLNSQGFFFFNPLQTSLSHCLPSPPMFPEEELGDILFRDRVHRVGAALDF